MTSKSLPGRIERPKALEAGFEHARAGDEDGMGNALLDHRLRGAQHALVLAHGVDDALLVLLRALEQRTHDEAGAEDELVELLVIGVEIGDGPGGDAGVHGRLGHRRGDAQDEARIERRRNDAVRTEGAGLAAIGAGDHVGGRLAGERGDGFHRRHLHLGIDVGGTHIQRAAEDVGEAEDVVHLVREVRTAGADHGVGPHGAGLFRHDLGLGLASARMSGRSAMRWTISGFSTPPAERPRKMCAPSITSASVRGVGLLA